MLRHNFFRVFKLALPSTDYPTAGMTAPSHVLDSTVCSRVWFLCMYVCVCVTPPPWFISSDAALFLRAITVDWESAVWACNDCLHQFLACTGLWRSLSNIPVANAKQSHQISSLGSSSHGVRFSLCVFAEFSHRGDDQNAFSFSAPRSDVIQGMNSVWTLWSRKPPVVCSSTLHKDGGQTNRFLWRLLKLLFSKACVEGRRSLWLEALYIFFLATSFFIRVTDVLWH